MAPLAAGIVCNNDMFIDKARGGYLSSVMAVTEEVFCYAFVYENIIKQNILGGLKTICHFNFEVWESCAWPGQEQTLHETRNPLQRGTDTVTVTQFCFHNSSTWCSASCSYPIMPL